ncbi:type VI secretion system-associated lipoprotein [Halorhodospira abdelmalekii]|uniref:type VI secretion system lipoprotein TssJ n=1 Tax=Halorhodospira abdelmalekii TaxID=421629 RepID=UPI00237A2242|nr:type VI secretion system lipoprotein TssJ [Halorhodospira abdelmalekii]MBK1735818.1 type VI secretion system-associated lipoprotein [Halorhodospira abdelmalekii]
MSRTETNCSACRRLRCKSCPQTGSHSGLQLGSQSGRTPRGHLGHQASCPANRRPSRRPHREWCSRWGSVGALALGLLLMTGCNPQIRLTLDADADINPNAEGDALSLLLRIYQLDSSETFSQLDYDELLFDDGEALGSSLIERHEVVIRPRQYEHLDLPMASAAQQLGVVAFYREPASSGWRASETLPSGLFGLRGDRRLRVQLSGTSLRLGEPSASSASGKPGARGEAGGTATTVAASGTAAGEQHRWPELHRLSGRSSGRAVRW